MKNTRTCDKCKQSIPMSEIKMYPKEGDRVWMVCGNCLGDLKKKIQPKAALKMTTAGETPLRQIEKRPTVSKLKENYVCRKCKFNFSIDTDKQKARCPYCGKNDIVMVRGY